MMGLLEKGCTQQGIQGTSKVCVGSSSSLGFSIEGGKRDTHNENLKGKSSQKSNMLTVGSHKSNSKRLPGASL